MRTIDDVLDELDTMIDRAIDAGDRAGYFAILYRNVTAKVKEGIAAGFFDDPQRMERLDVLFAARYLDAVRDHAAGGPVTDSWALTFAAAGRRRPLVLQHLLFGINAHINLDLGIAAARCSPGADHAGLRGDYERINQILAAMIASVQADLLRISPWMRWLDAIGARTQHELIRFSIVVARSGAWQFATALNATAPDAWDAAIADRDARVARVGRMVLNPGALMSAGLLLVRARERGDVRANLRLLRDAPAPPLQAAVRPDLDVRPAEG